MSPPPPPPPPSLPSTTTTTKRRWTKQQLLRNLEILGTLGTPLSPNLPPSPPASRPASPAPPLKRKLDPPSDLEHTKRPRTSSSLSDRFQSHPLHHSPHSLPPPPHLRPSNLSPLPYNARNEPCEDGEVREEPVVASSSRLPLPPPPPTSAPVALSTTAVPIRRPKRGKPTHRYFDSLHDKYHNHGRMLKYSGDARFWSTYPSTHREYRPLLDPPPPNSPYHIHGGLIARLELVDALVCFTYSIWNKDYSRRSCNRDTWGTIEAFLGWCKQKWQAEEGMIDAEKAFIGLIWMIEAFIHGRKMTYIARTPLDADMDKLHASCKTKVLAAAIQAEQENPSGLNPGLLPTKSQATPPMLPSPASIAPANSANSTPTTRDGGTPNTTASTSSNLTAHLAAPYPPNQTIIPIPLLPDRLVGVPIPAHVMAAMMDVTVTAGPQLVQNLKNQTSGTIAAAWCMTTSQNTLNLPILARFFPNTFARVIHTTLSPVEEHEPDFEDEEGELFWPGQSVTGEGLGWVCLMGKAMIKEFGKAYGYKGIDGVVPKPKPEEEESSGAPPIQGQNIPQRPNPGQGHSHTSHRHPSQGLAPIQGLSNSSVQR